MATDGTVPAQAPTHESLDFPLQEGEGVLEICRRHWIQLWPKVALFAAIALVPPFIIAWLMDAAGAYDSDEGFTRFFWIISALWILYWVIRALLNWYQYHHDSWVITNQRIVDTYKRTPFNLKISTADLVNLQDISVERSGILRTALDYGDIICTTASDRRQFTLSAIPDPRRVQALIDRERDRERKANR